MCQNTRYPAAYPLHTLTAKSVVRALMQFIGIFGIPKVIQSDQGSNFSSHVFAQVLKQLHIKHNQSTAYHAQSQGALERFHQTLKSLLRAYCVQMNADWEDGLSWLLLAAREVTQESTGFSPNELVFGHTVRGPLKVLKDECHDAEPPQNLLNYVNGFKQRLFTATQLAKRKLSSAQDKMKRWYDKKAEHHVFLSGDQVMALLPVVTSPFQAKFSGPHTVLKRLSDQNYLIATPERRKKWRILHVNLLKPYHVRVDNVLVDEVHPVCIAETVTSAGDEGSGDGLPVPDSAMLTGRLKNSEVLDSIDTVLSYLSESQRFELIQLIKSHSDLFADVPSCTHLIEHDIEVGDVQPIKQQFYRVNPDKRKHLDAEVDYMLKNGIAQASCSSWSSPCLLVPKSDKTYRFCSDFRKVNSITKPDSYPLPRMDDCIDQIGNAKFISKIDLLKGYWQVPLTKRAQEISAFITPSGLYSYNVLPFGLRNAPATFQRLMNKVVGCLDGCSVYLDDVVVYSDSWSSHMERLTALFDRLRDARLTVNLAKCDFARATVTYLGHQVGQGKVRPVSAKVEAIEKYPVPTTKEELMKFLGLVGYYRAFCRNFSTVVAPLTDLLKSNVKYIWSSVCQ
uniref:ribonuclease H n=1 Tax=Poecilia mexicana TaxID=48701 RepID=A0A3B3XS13_9TELE